MEKKKTILIIEDEKNIRESIVDVLRLNNFITLEARNGQEGVDLALSKYPDLILLDLLMPVMDGMTAFKKIREDAWGKNVPVIILTNVSANEKDLVRGMVEQKPLYYLVKSDWKIHDVVEKIEKILK